VVLQQLGFSSVVVHQACAPDVSRRKITLITSHDTLTFLKLPRRKITLITSHDTLTSPQLSRVIQESIAALFNSGNNCACVVNVGSHNTTVCCVDEGVVLPDSRILLPYGSLHLAESLFWALQLFADWPYRECDPVHNTPTRFNPELLTNCCNTEGRVFACREGGWGMRNCCKACSSNIWLSG
jgi:hypothetical protein